MSNHKQISEAPTLFDQILAVKKKVYEFDPHYPAFLQTPHTKKDKCFWTVLNAHRFEQGFSIEVAPTAQSVIDALALASQQPYTNRSQLFEAMLPLIRAVSSEEAAKTQEE